MAIWGLDGYGEGALEVIRKKRGHGIRMIGQLSWVSAKRANRGIGECSLSCKLVHLHQVGESILRGIGFAKRKIPIDHD